ncbi:General control protein GCN4 [Zancudomyces culisetae]|uniref:General control protein GCN4 n=1 Tax=Zancudomyces culisetae TaxID=1213189 RepID=A0A1R1PUD3_ZANCU|nr:General control protein GCN4 [Zancudomyces culisetae]|eukprot:OMH84606.1 General control protein GCN4 [Zancudomyces culisetae]
MKQEQVDQIVLMLYKALNKLGNKSEDHEAEEPQRKKQREMTPIEDSSTNIMNMLDNLKCNQAASTVLSQLGTNDKNGTFSTSNIENDIGGNASSINGQALQDLLSTPLSDALLSPASSASLTALDTPASFVSDSVLFGGDSCSINGTTGQDLLPFGGFISSDCPNLFSKDTFGNGCVGLFFDDLLTSGTLSGTETVQDLVNIETTSEKQPCVLSTVDAKPRPIANPVKPKAKPKTARSSTVVDILPKVNTLEGSNSDLSATPTTNASTLLKTTPIGSDAFRKECDNKFLTTLPPQLALKRKRTRSRKQLAAIDSIISNPSPDASIDSVTNPDDSSLEPDALKRLKNTDAARRSRLRKALRLDTLEKHVAELESDNLSLKSQVSTLQLERSEFFERESKLLAQISSLNSLLLSFSNYSNQ